MQVGDGAVRVVLTGSAASSCDLPRSTAALQAQQLAWAVVANSDLPTDLGVGFVDGTGKASVVWLADPAWVVDE